MSERKLTAYEVLDLANQYEHNVALCKLGAFATSAFTLVYPWFAFIAIPIVFAAVLFTRTMKLTMATVSRTRFGLDQFESGMLKVRTAIIFSFLAVVAGMICTGLDVTKSYGSSGLTNTVTTKEDSSLVAPSWSGSPSDTVFLK